MFTKTKRARDGNPTIPSIIGGDMRVSGNLTTDGEVHIEGVVDGDVSCDSLVLGDDAAVTGKIEARDVSVRGTVTGEIKAENVSLTKTSRVNGDIVHESLAIESGAYVEGQMRRMDSAKDRITVVSTHAAGSSGTSAAEETPETSKPKESVG